MLKLTELNFRQEVIDSDVPVMIEFYSRHCGKCAMMEEVVDSLEERLSRRVKFGRVDIDECKRLEAEYEIEIVPTYMVFKNGMAIACMIGVVNEETIKDRIEEML